MSTDTINLAYYYFTMDTEFEGKSIHSYAEILLPTNIISAIFFVSYPKYLFWVLGSSKLEPTYASFKPANISHKPKKISFKTNKKTPIKINIYPNYIVTKIFHT